MSLCEEEIPDWLVVSDVTRYKRKGMPRRGFNLPESNVLSGCVSVYVWILNSKLDEVRGTI